MENSANSVVKCVKNFDKNLVAVTCRKGHLFWDTPTIVDACALDLAKYHIIYFHDKVSCFKLHPKMFNFISFLKAVVS